MAKSKKRRSRRLNRLHSRYSYEYETPVIPLQTRRQRTLEKKGRYEEVKRKVLSIERKKTTNVYKDRTYQPVKLPTCLEERKRVRRAYFAALVNMPSGRAGRKIHDDKLTPRNCKK